MDNFNNTLNEALGVGPKTAPTSRIMPKVAPKVMPKVPISKPMKAAPIKPKTSANLQTFNQQPPTPRPVVQFTAETISEPKAPVINEQDRRAKAVDKLVYKLGGCIDYQSVYALEEDFNKAGLTIQTTANNRIILCKLNNGKPIANSIVEDYIFVGSLDTSINELSDRAVMKISDFVRTNASFADTVRNIPRVWRNGLKMYESTIPIMNEDVNSIANSID